MKTRTVTVNVTKRRIKEGDCGSAGHCPIAIAINEHLSRPFRVSVWRSVGIIAESGGPFEYEVMLSERVNDWRINFDTEKPVEPFRFRLAIPVRFLKRK